MFIRSLWIETNYCLSFRHLAAISFLLPCLVFSFVTLFDKVYLNWFLVLERLFVCPTEWKVFLSNQFNRQTKRTPKSLAVSQSSPVRLPPKFEIINQAADCNDYSFEPRLFWFGPDVPPHLSLSRSFFDCRSELSDLFIVCLFAFQ